MPRIANDCTFRLDALVDKRVAELLAATSSKVDCHIEMLFLRVLESDDWHRVFLDAGIGFWEVWNETDAFIDYDDLRLIDFASRWNLAGETVLSAECRGGTWDDSNLSEFVVTLTSGVIQLKFSDPSDLESGSIISFQPLPKIGT